MSLNESYFRIDRSTGYRRRVPISAEEYRAMNANNPRTERVKVPATWPTDMVDDPAVAICEDCQNFRTTNFGNPICIRRSCFTNSQAFVTDVRVRNCPIGLLKGIPKR